MSYLIIELETQLLKTGKASADLIRATGHTPANISELEERIVERAKNVVRQMRDVGGNEVSLPTSVFAVDLSDE